MFLDEAKITVHGGNGGNGLVSWRREKFIARGGPWGGDGGNGGNVIIRAVHNVDTLTAFAQKKVFHAKHGGNGGKARKHGATAEDLILKVPPGTVITRVKCEERASTRASSRGTDPDANASASSTRSLSAAQHDITTIADLANDGDEVVVAKGGRGGYGNAHFASSVRQAPDFAEKGEPGEEVQLSLELKLVAEVGIIGYPSVGKSTLISVISNAKPKIADYEFTTLVPNLGVVNVHDRSFVVCDVPGLIEGASEGKGLGDKFLKHIERCGVLVHVLDVNRENIVEDYRAIRKELEAYSPTLAQKKEIVVLNKIDLIQSDATMFEDELKKNDIAVFASVSSASKIGIEEFLNKLLPIVLEHKEESGISSPAGRAGNQESGTVILRPHIESDRTEAFVIEKEDDVFIVRGKRIEQIAAMTDWNNPSGVQRFRDIVTRTGIRDALEKAGTAEESKIHIGKIDVSSYL